MGMNTPGLPPMVGPIPTMAKDDSFEDNMIGTSLSETADAAVYLSAPSGSGTAVVQDGVDGNAILLTTQASDTTYEIIKLNGEPFVTGTDHDLLFYAEFQLGDASVAEMYVGLHDDADADVIDVATHEGIGFIIDAAGNGLDYVLGDGTSVGQVEVKANSALADDTTVKVAFVCSRRDYVRFYADAGDGNGWSDGVKVTANIPTGNLTLVAQVQSSGAAETLQLRKWGCWKVSR